MKKLIALSCAAMLIFATPTIAFGDGSRGLDSRDYVIPSVASERIADADGVIFSSDATISQVDGFRIFESASAVSLKNSSKKDVGSISHIEIRWPGVEKMETKAILDGSVLRSAPEGFQVEDAKTVLSDTSFILFFQYDDVTQVGPSFQPDLTGSASFSFTYEEKESVVNTLADDNEVDSSNIKLILYKMPVTHSEGIDYSSVTYDAPELVESVQANEPLKASISPAESAAYVLALVCDTDLLGSKPKPKPEQPEQPNQPAPDQPVPDTDADSKVDPDDNSDSGSNEGGYSDDSDAPSTPLVHTGSDTSTTSPKTGQVVSAETAPLALAVTAVLGGATIVAARRRARTR